MSNVNKILIKYFAIFFSALIISLVLINTLPMFKFSSLENYAQVRRIIINNKVPEYIKTLYVGDSTCRYSLSPSRDDFYLCVDGRSPVELLPLVARIIKQSKVDNIVFSFLRFNSLRKNNEVYLTLFDIDELRDFYRMFKNQKQSSYDFILFAARSMKSFLDLTFSKNFNFQLKRKVILPNYQSPSFIYPKKSKSLPCLKEKYDFKKDESLQNFENNIDKECLLSNSIGRISYDNSLTLEALSYYAKEIKNNSPKVNMIFIIPPILDWHGVSSGLLKKSTKLSDFIENALNKDAYKILRYDVWDKELMGDLTHVNEVGSNIIQKDLEKLIGN